MTKRVQKTLFFAVKALIAVGLLGWVLSRVHWHDYVIARDGGGSLAVLERSPAQGESDKLLVGSGFAWRRSQRWRPVGDFESVDEGSRVIRPGFASTMKEIDLSLLLCAIGGLLVSLLIIAVRLRGLLRIQQVHIKIWEAIRLMFLGQFFNAVVPGTVGGDLVKAYYVSKHTPKKAAVLVSVFLDRVMGLAALTILSAAMVAVILASKLETFQTMRLPAITVAVAMTAVAGMLAVLLSSRFRNALRLHKFYGRLSIAGHIASAGEAARLYRRNVGGLARAMAMTFGAHLAWIGSVVLIGMSLSLQIPLYSYVVYIPLIYILGAVPLSPGGVGIVENFYVIFFASAACGPSEILALALLARFLQLFWGLPGSVVAITGPKLPKTAEIESELGLGRETAGGEAQ